MLKIHVLWLVWYKRNAVVNFYWFLRVQSSCEGTLTGLFRTNLCSVELSEFLFFLAWFFVTDLLNSKWSRIWKIIVEISLHCDIDNRKEWARHSLRSPLVTCTKMADSYLYKNFRSICDWLWISWLLKWVQNNTQQSYQSILCNVEMRGFSWVYFWCEKYPKIWTETLAQVWTRFTCC